jgi:UDP-N-acetylmuramoylalanine-D-glutamate ligase
VSLLSALTDFPSGSVPERGVSWFGGGDGFRLAHSAIWRDKRRLYALSDLPLPGEHNALNACAALAAVEAAGSTRAGCGRARELHAAAAPAADARLCATG